MELLPGHVVNRDHGLDSSIKLLRFYFMNFKRQHTLVLMVLSLCAAWISLFGTYAVCGMLIYFIGILDVNNIVAFKIPIQTAMVFGVTRELPTICILSCLLVCCVEWRVASALRRFWFHISHLAGWALFCGAINLMLIWPFRHNM
jgi:hypothetical protein